MKCEKLTKRMIALLMCIMVLIFFAACHEVEEESEISDQVGIKSEENTEKPMDEIEEEIQEDINETVKKLDPTVAPVENYQSFANIIQEIQKSIGFEDLSDEDKEYCRGELFEVNGKEALVTMFYATGNGSVEQGIYVGLWSRKEDNSIVSLVNEMIDEADDLQNTVISVNIRKVGDNDYLNYTVRRYSGNKDVWKNNYYLIEDKAILEYKLYNEDEIREVDGIVELVSGMHLLNDEEVESKVFYAKQDELNKNSLQFSLDPFGSDAEGILPQGSTFNELLEQINNIESKRAINEVNFEDKFNLTEDLGLTKSAINLIMGTYEPFCKNLSKTYESSEGDVVSEKSCVIVEFEKGIPSLVVRYKDSRAYDPGVFCEAWIVYGVKDGNVVELMKEENYAPTRREIQLVYNEMDLFGLREEESAGYTEIKILYPNNSKNSLMSGDYNRVKMPEENNTLRVCSINGNYVDINL